jgi:hypothetical protein
MVKAIKTRPVIQALQLTALWGGGAYGNRNDVIHPLSAYFKLNSDLVAYINIFMEPSDCDEVLLCEIYFVRGMVLLME